MGWPSFCMSLRSRQQVVDRTCGKHKGPASWTEGPEEAHNAR